MVYQDPFAMVNAYLARFGDEVGARFDPLDSDGYTDVRHGDLRVGINVLQDPGLLLLLIKMGDCPEHPEHAAKLYRQLLELNFLATQDCAFAVDRARGAIYLRAMRRLDGLDYVEFQDLLQDTVAVAEEMSERLSY